MRGLPLIVLIACSNEPAPIPPWQKSLPPSSVMGDVARGIIHLHSPYSHDACDGDGYVDGAVDEACLADLRHALCTTRMDFAALTDHDAYMDTQPFDDLFLLRDDDVRVGAASRITCDDGHQVLWTVGGENPLMPIMLDRHLEGADYDGNDAATADAMRAAGALVWIPHTESRTIDEIVAVAPAGIEVYQLHANLDPDIREEHLGLPAGGAIERVVAFADTNPGHPEPDLALISFLEPNAPALAMWDELLARGLRVAGSGGTDAHQNALPIELADGERGDSYRRMLRWFSNVVRVDDPGDPAAIEAALAAGDMFVAFELLGTPVGFAEEVDGDTLTVTLPTVHDLDPALAAPEISGRVIEVGPGGRAVVAEGIGTLTVTMNPGHAYRVEVDIRPLHLGPYLGNLGTAYAERTLPWIYGSPHYSSP